MNIMLFAWEFFFLFYQIEDIWTDCTEILKQCLDQGLNFTSYRFNILAKLKYDASVDNYYKNGGGEITLFAFFLCFPILKFRGGEIFLWQVYVQQSRRIEIY